MHLYSHLVSNRISLANPSSWASSLREAFDSERENFARQHLDATGPTRPGALGLHLVGNDHPPFVGHIRVYIYIYLYIYICICVCVMDVMQSNVK
jgi:hypothetical protein